MSKNETGKPEGALPPAANAGAAPAAASPPESSPPAAARPAPGAGRLKDGDHVDRERTEPTTDAEKDRAMRGELRARTGDSRSDRFKITAPIANARVVNAGIQFVEGVGYTRDAKAANICRGLGYQVIDRMHWARDRNGNLIEPKTAAEKKEGE